jgi:hypothetical protein
MKAFIVVLLVGPWLAGAPAVRAESGVDTATYSTATYSNATYSNAEVVRVNDTARTLVYRDGSGQKTVAVDRTLFPEFSRLKRGDKVLLTTRVISTAAGETRFVTEVRPTSPSSANRARP